MSTIKFDIHPPTIILCTDCKAPLNKYYFVHQCKRLPHALCYICLLDKKLCKRCELPYHRLMTSGTIQSLKYIN